MRNDNEEESWEVDVRIKKSIKCLSSGSAHMSDKGRNVYWQNRGKQKAYAFREKAQHHACNVKSVSARGSVSVLARAEMPAAVSCLIVLVLLLKWHAGVSEKSMSGGGVGGVVNGKFLSEIFLECSYNVVHGCVSENKLSSAINGVSQNGEIVVVLILPLAFLLLKKYSQ